MVLNETNTEDFWVLFSGAASLFLMLSTIYEKAASTFSPVNADVSKKHILCAFANSYPLFISTFLESILSHFVAIKIFSTPCVAC